MVPMIEIIELLPTWYLYTCVFFLGLIIGSFLNVVIYRYHTSRSLSGHSHCLSCGEKLRWFELFPLVSYLCLRGRCGSCGCRIPARYFVVELSTALLFLTAATQLPVGLLLLFTLALISVLMVVTVYDMYHMVIPDELVLTICGLALVYFGLASYPTFSLTALGWHAAAALGAFLFYGGLWFVSKGRWIGFGDAKLAIPLGFMLGMPAVFTFVVFSFWIGAVISLCMLGLPYLFQIVRAWAIRVTYLFTKKEEYLYKTSAHQYKTLTMKSEVPFAPFMIAAFLLVYLFHADVLTLVAFFI